MQLDKEYIRATNVKRYVTLADGTQIPAIGQGTWFMGEQPEKAAQEIDALRLGVELGMSLVDTAEMYGSGGAELVVGEALKGIREQVFLVSKVYPHNAGGIKAIKACEASLKRLKTEYLDLYLLHWRGSISFAETVDVMEQLVSEGKIKRWGVSNLSINDMQDLWQIANGTHCVTNQVLYHLGSRGIEYDLMPWCFKYQMPIMAYCPLAQAGSLRRGLLVNETVRELASAKQCTVAQLLLAWSIRSGAVIAIPKASTMDHVVQNAQASAIVFSEDELARLDQAFPPPSRKQPLDIV